MISNSDQGARSKISNYKWIVLTSFFMNSVTNVFMFTALSPIWYFCAEFYNVTDYTLNWFTNQYYIGPLTIAFLFNPFVIRYYGVSQIISCALTACGLWICVYANNNFNLALLGFILIGIGEGTFYQVPLQLSKIWFEQNLRITSTFIAQYANNVGMLIGYLTSSIYFYNVVDLEDFSQKYQTMLKYISIFASISCFLSLVTLKKPPNTLEQLYIRDTIWMSFKKICSTRESLLDIFSASFFIGTSWCYGTFFGYQLFYDGYDTLSTYIINNIFQISQIIMALICTILLQKQSKEDFYLSYDSCIKYTINMGFWCVVFEILFNEYLPFVMLCFLNIFIGCGLGGLYSIMLESLMEKHYPVQELAIGTCFAAGASIISILLTMILLLQQYVQFCFQISCYLMILPYTYITIFYNTKFQRLQQEG